MSKKFLTLDDLLLFCKENNFNHFNANEAGGPIVVHTHGTFEASDSSKCGLLPVKLQACHINLNNNGSFISSESMTNALPSFSNRPILANIHQLDDGTWDFRSHDIEIVEDESSEDGVRVEYIEQPIGVIPESCNAHLEYDENKEHTYVCVDGYLFEEYSRACDIIREKGVTKVSVELAINELSYDAKEGYLKINDFYFMGVTALGREKDGTVIKEGMEGSNMTLGSFSQENNSVVTDDMQSKMFELLTKLNDALEKFNDTNDSEKKGGNEMDKFNELLEKYGVTVEDIDFEYENVDDETLEQLFADKFGSDGSDDGADAGSDEGSDEGDSDDGSDEGADDTKYALTYQLSHDDIRCGIYNLLSASLAENTYAWVAEVYDNYFIYEECNYETGSYKYVKQSYSVEGDDISFSGDSVEVFPEFVTESEKNALAALRLEYAELKAFKEEIEKQALQVKKDEILNNEKYSVLNGNEKFEQLKNDAEKFSVEDIEKEVKLIFADFVMEIGSYSSSVESVDTKSKKIGFNFNDKPNKVQAYAGLFDEE